jgi:methionyl-tRNA formyltransferase
MKSNYSVLFLGKADDPYTEQALDFCRKNFANVEAYLGRWGEKLPAEVKQWNGDLIVSFLSRWVIPELVIRAARIEAINFHPGPPEYPGIGCNNFALYDEATVYGTTCHRMATKVDTGEILAVRRFPVHETDSVRTLLVRCYENQLILFEEILNLLIKGHNLVASNERWMRKPFTREELENLFLLTREMSKEEMLKRIRATTFGPWLPRLEINGIEFTVSPRAAKTLGFD